ncbi:MAG TPA: phosphatase PAP2 family protein [Flavipsychrobacter sp.]|jgi:undecaprenyl-diphosphatase|nr:phosphatase PAP2 family protein [Flavipsychrobacter sp.]
MPYKFIKLFILLSVTSFISFAQQLDLTIYDQIHANRNTSLDGSMNVISQTNYPIALALPLGQLIYSVFKHDEKSILTAAQTIGGLVFTTAITYGLKYSVQRERPYIAHPQYTPYEYDKSPSMPSGHTSFAFATATCLSLEYKKWYVVVPAYLYAGAVGYSRIHLGAHYPSDVLVGALVGAGSSFASYKISNWLHKKWEKRTKTILLD